MTPGASAVGVAARMTPLGEVVGDLRDGLPVWLTVAELVDVVVVVLEDDVVGEAVMEGV